MFLEGLVMALLVAQLRNNQQIGRLNGCMLVLLTDKKQNG